MTESDYIVEFGRAGHLGRFTGSGEFARGDRVVVRSSRGLEEGVVLGPARHALADPFIGSVLRAMSDADRAAASSRRDLAARLFARAAELADGIAVVDAEVLLDGRGAILHAIAGAVDAGPLLDQLAGEFNLIVRLYDLAAESPAPAPADGHEEQFRCDKPDCGEGDCSDCGTGGGCSSCSAGSQDDLREYFAGLRQAMESRVPLA
jgi:hypothetical protein